MLFMSTCTHWSHLTWEILMHTTKMFLWNCTMFSLHGETREHIHPHTYAHRHTFFFLDLAETLEKLRWESLKKRRTYSRINLMYKGLKGVASIPTDVLLPIRCSRNHHTLTFQTPAARTDIYKGSFFPKTIRDWNALTDLIISSTEGPKDGVAQFISGES